MEEDWDRPRWEIQYRKKRHRRDMTENWDSPDDEEDYNYRPNQKDTWRKKNIIKRDDNRNLVITVSTSKVGWIIGRQGAKIKELQQKSGTRIKIGEPCKDDPSLTEISIAGDDYSQRECQRLINNLTQHERTNGYETRKTWGEAQGHETRKAWETPNAYETTSEMPQEPKDNFLIDWDAVNEKAEIAEKERWAHIPTIKKDFYIEHPDVKNMSPEEVKKFRESNNNIMVRVPFGDDDSKVLNPVQTFEQAFEPYPEIMNEIKRMGFEKPSPIQCQAWPILLSGRDLIGIAQTGTGKTLAFLLPALIHIHGQEVPRSERNGANVLVLAPTRELALQIQKEVEKYSYKDIKCVCVYGGGNRNEQKDTIIGGVEIIIATPGRLNDLVETGVINLDSITYLVLDEADRMLDMGFEPQIRKVLLDIRPDRQSAMTSATWNANVQRLAEKYMNSPVQVYIGSLDLAAVHSVTQTVWVVEEEKKDDYLLDFIKSLSDEDKLIVFVGKKKVADFLSADLSLRNILCQCIHGDREQMDREQAIEDLKTGEVNILIATDVASRGLDITDVTKVFNYDFPKNIEEYVHRVGRTGRAGRTGEAVTLFTRADWACAGELITIMEEANQEVPSELYAMKERYLNRRDKKSEDGYGDSREAGGGRGFGRGRTGRGYSDERGSGGYRYEKGEGRYSNERGRGREYRGENSGRSNGFSGYRNKRY